MGVRRAFLWASAARYINITLSLGVTLVLARLLAPEEYGVAVLGGSVFAVAEGLRAVGGGAYLVQKHDLRPGDVRAWFTVNLTATIVVAVALWLLADPLAHFFAVPQLGQYIRVAALGYLAGPFGYPISALLSRNLAFGTLAAIGTASAVISATVSITLATSGHSYMSFAWAGAVSSLAGMLLSVWCWKDRTIFRPSFRGWPEVLRFGLYDSATAVVSQVTDSLPYFIFGKLLSADAVGIGQRVVTLCLVPERVILAGVAAVALPAFSRDARQGGSLSPLYLRAITLITAAQWPSLLLLAILARPLVALLLGPHWSAVVPLLQILACALLLSFPIMLHYATLVAAGAIRIMAVTIALQSAASIVVLTAVAPHGLHAAALSALVILPCNGLMSLLLAKRYLRFGWRDVLVSTRGSAFAAVLATLGPAALWALYHDAGQPPAATLAALALSAVGWFAGLYLTRHPILGEMRRALGALRNSGNAIRAR